MVSMFLPENLSRTCLCLQGWMVWLWKLQVFRAAARRGGVLQIEVFCSIFALDKNAVTYIIFAAKHGRFLKTCTVHTLAF